MRGHKLAGVGFLRDYTVDIEIAATSAGDAPGADYLDLKPKPSRYLRGGTWRARPRDRSQNT